MSCSACQYHYDKYSSIWSKGGRYFYYVKKGLQNQHVLCTMVRPLMTFWDSSTEAD